MPDNSSPYFSRGIFGYLRNLQTDSPPPTLGGLIDPSAEQTRNRSPSRLESRSRRVSHEHKHQEPHHTSDSEVEDETSNHNQQDIQEFHPTNQDSSEDNEDSEDEYEMPPIVLDGMPQIDLQAHQQLLDRVKELEEEKAEYVDKNGVRQQLPKQMCDEIKKMIKNEVWRTYKFVSNPASHKLLVQKTCFLCVPELAADTTQDQKDNIELWCDMFGNYCLQQLNNTRSYVIGQLRKAVLQKIQELHAANLDIDKELPDFNLMKKITQRQINGETGGAACNKEVEQFVWYLTEILPKATANPTHWGKSKMAFTKVSQAHFPGNPGKLYIPSSTEAFILVVWEGYLDLWKHQFQLKLKNPKADIKPPQLKAGERPTAEQKKLLAKCTTLDVGQKKYGGWDGPYMAKFVQYKQATRLGREGARSLSLETMATIKIKTLFGIHDETLADYEANKKKRKSQAEPVYVDYEGLCGDEE